MTGEVVRSHDLFIGSLLAVIYSSVYIPWSPRTAQLCGVLVARTAAFKLKISKRNLQCLTNFSTQCRAKRKGQSTAEIMNAVRSTELTQMPHFDLSITLQRSSHPVWLASRNSTDLKSVNLVWRPIWGSWPDINYYRLTVTVLFLWVALSDERTGLSFVYAAGPCQRGLSRFRVPWDSRPYFTVSDLRLPLSSPPT
jgi:hypothetical protein